jgi:hypothetical protein
MDDAFHAILESLPPRRRRSKLEPYAPLIQALRTRGRSYREIASILRDRCGVSVGVHTLYHFVRVRAQRGMTSRTPRPAPSPAPVRSSARDPTTSSPKDGDKHIWERIAAVKGHGAPAAATARKEFVYDENEPLHLIPDRHAKKKKA